MYVFARAECMEHGAQQIWCESSMMLLEYFIPRGCVLCFAPGVPTGVVCEVQNCNAKAKGPGGLVVYGPNALVSCSPLWTTHSRSHSRRFRPAKTDRPPTDGCAPNQATKVTNGYHKDEIVAQQTHTFCGRTEGKVFG